MGNNATVNIHKRIKCFHFSSQQIWLGNLLEMRGKKLVPGSLVCSFWSTDGISFAFPNSKAIIEDSSAWATWTTVHLHEIERCSCLKYLSLIEMPGIHLMSLACRIVNHWLHSACIDFNSSKQNSKWQFISMSFRFWFFFSFLLSSSLLLSSNSHRGIVFEPRSMVVAMWNEPLPLPHRQPNSF